MQTCFYVIYSRTSRYGVHGLWPHVMLSSRQNVIEAAGAELHRIGETLEGLAGVEWVEGLDGCFHPARELTANEVLTLSIEKLGDDGRLCDVFGTDEAGAAAFVEAAESYGSALADKARALVKRVNS